MSVFAWPYLQPLYNTHLRLHPHPANNDAGTPPWPTHFSPAANNDDARPPFTPLPPSPGYTQPAQPVTQPTSHSAGRIHPVTTSSHQQRWCAKPARPAPAQPSGAAQGRRWPPKSAHERVPAVPPTPANAAPTALPATPHYCTPAPLSAWPLPGSAPCGGKTRRH